MLYTRDPVVVMTKKRPPRRFDVLFSHEKRTLTNLGSLNSFLAPGRCTQH